MNYSIAIPSFKRYGIINDYTIKVLEAHNIPSECITIFVIEDEYELYRNVVDIKYKIVVGQLGLVNQRNFIENYYPTNSYILFLDDDIKEIDMTLGTTQNLNEFIELAFQDCINNNAFIWSVYPVYNLFFRTKAIYKTDCLNYCIGAFYGIINRPNDNDLILKYSLDGNKEDVERSIVYFKKDGKTIRYNQIGFRTTYYGSVGGLGTLKERMNDIIKNTNLLKENYSMYGKIKIRKSGIYEFELKKIPSFDIDNNVICGEYIDNNLFSNLLNMLHNLKFRYITKNNRINFPAHRSAIFGITKNRKNSVGLSMYTKKYPEIFEELKKIAILINPNFIFNSIYINNNVICPKHIDSNNVGQSMLISIGEYSGCKLVINNVVYDTQYKPIYFNGACIEHYNTDDLIGNKYSIIYFNVKCNTNKNSIII